MNNKYKVLLVEDDEKIRSITSVLLKSANYQVIIAETCSDAKTLFSSYQPDVVILDLGLPDMDGMNFIEYVRADSLVPVIVLSARSGESDKVAALDAGANDYVTKPFSSEELLARIRTAIRNSCQGAGSARLPGEKFQVDDLVIDYDARQVFVKDEEIKLSQTEYNIIAFLSMHCGKMMTYSSIIKNIWGYSDYGSVKKLQVNMANIRKKFGVKPGEARYITNELGVGYRMEGKKEN